MKLDASATAESLLVALTDAARATWGAERLAALQPTLEAAAGNLAILAGQPLEYSEHEPDFISAPEA